MVSNCMQVGPQKATRKSNLSQEVKMKMITNQMIDSSRRGSSAASSLEWTFLKRASSERA